MNKVTPKKIFKGIVAISDRIGWHQSFLPISLLALLIFAQVLPCCRRLHRSLVGNEYYSPRHGTTIKIVNKKEMQLKFKDKTLVGKYSIKGKELRFDFQAEGKKGFLLFKLKSNKLIPEDSFYVYFLSPPELRALQNQVPSFLNEAYSKFSEQKGKKGEYDGKGLRVSEFQSPLPENYQWQVCLPSHPCEIPQHENLGKFPQTKCASGCFMIMAYGNLDKDDRLDIWLISHKIDSLPDQFPLQLSNDLYDFDYKKVIRSLQKKRDKA